MKTRTAELAALAKAAGFTPEECHRAMLDGAAKFLRSVANENRSVRDLAILNDMAMALDHLQSNMTLMGGIE